VTTGAEWITTRFGTGRGSRLSHLIVVIFALFSVIGFLTYGFKGIGKFATDFLPWHFSRPREASRFQYRRDPDSQTRIAIQDWPLLDVLR
jgi:hypothetical protein